MMALMHVKPSLVATWLIISLLDPVDLTTKTSSRRVSDIVLNKTCQQWLSLNSTKDLRPCEQVPIKQIIADAYCPYQSIDETRNLLCEVEGGKAKGCPSFSGHNKPMRIFKTDTMEISQEVTKKQLSDGEVWVEYNFAPRAVLVHKIHFRRPNLNVSSSPSSYQLLGFGNIRLRNGTEETRWTLIHRFQDISIFPGQRAIHSIPFRRLGRFTKYRLVITGTLWKQNENTVKGHVAIGDLQLCYQKLTSHHMYNIPRTLIEVSSKWSKDWGGEKAFNGTTTMWASELQYRASFIPQWVSFEYPQPKTIKRFTFMGASEKRWFGDGPTAYKIEATNDYLEWVTLFTHINGDVFDTDIILRQHDIEAQEHKPYKKYKFIVTETGWMRKGLEHGYVVVRDLLLC